MDLDPHLRLTDPAPDPAFIVSGLQDTDKKLTFYAPIIYTAPCIMFWRGGFRAHTEGAEEQVHKGNLFALLGPLSPPPPSLQNLLEIKKQL